MNIAAGRVPPHDLDAEAAVLSALLINEDAYYDVGGWLKASAFYSSANGAIYDAAIAVGARGGKIDAVTVCAHLRERGKLDSVGGTSYVGQLIDATPFSSNVVEHALIVASKSKLREMIAFYHRAAAEGYSVVDADVDAWLGDAMATQAKIASEGAEEVGTTMSAAVREAMDQWRNPSKSPTLGTGIAALDRAIGRLGQGHLIVIASHSGVGKSALACNVVSHVLIDEKVEQMPCGVLVFSLEMKSEEVIMRLACSRGRVDSNRIERDADGTGNDPPLSVDESRRFTVAANELLVQRLRIVDIVDITMPQIRAQARRVAAEFRREGTPLRLVVIDYAQMIGSGSGKRNGSREEEVAAIGREAKRMAGELCVPIILLSQLNNDARSEDLLSEADEAFVIHNPSVAERAGNGLGDYQPDMADNVEFRIWKCRSGPPCVVRALYWPTYTLFGDV